MIDPYKPLPISVKIDGVNIGMDMSFNNILEIFDTLNDKSLKDGEKVLFCLALLLDEIPNYEPKELFELWEKLYVEFIKTEDEESHVTYDIAGNPMPSLSVLEGEDEKVYDLKQDAAYIYSSFMYDYGLNLVHQQGKLHWHEFLALLNGLSEDSKLRQVIKIRQMDVPPHGKTEEEHKHQENVIKLKKAYALKKEV